MSYIPKSVQRKIDAQNRARSMHIASLIAAGVQVVAAEPFVPTLLNSGQPGAGMWDVFLDGVKQHLCLRADAKLGYIVRYTRGVGNKPTTRETEQMYGLVEFKRKQR